jgi:hypothetical protein
VIKVENPALAKLCMLQSQTHSGAAKRLDRKLLLAGCGDRSQPTNQRALRLPRLEYRLDNTDGGLVYFGSLVVIEARPGQYLTVVASSYSAYQTEEERHDFIRQGRATVKQVDELGPSDEFVFRIVNLADPETHRPVRFDDDVWLQIGEKPLGDHINILAAKLVSMAPVDRAEGSRAKVGTLSHCAPSIPAHTRVARRRWSWGRAEYRGQYRLSCTSRLS